VLLGLLCGTKSLVEMLLNQNVLMKIEKNLWSLRGVIETDEHLCGF
jgi:hypothetical protein